MATVTVTYLPAAGREAVDLTSWAGDAAFATTPVSGNQIEGPDTLTYAADGTVTGADGTYTLHHIIGATGAVESVSYTIGTVDATAPTLTALTATGTDPDTIDVSVTTDEGNGTLYAYASPNATESAATVKTNAQGGQVVTATGVQTIALTLAVGSYYVHAMHEDAAANQSTVVSSTQITLAAIPVVESASVTVNYIPPAGLTLTTLVEPINHYLDSIPGAEWASPAESGEQALSYTADGAFSSSFDWSGETEGTFPYWYINNAGQIFERDVIVVADAAVTEVPQGTWVIGTITKDQTTASLTPIYSGTDADSYEYTLNGSAWVTFTGTISFSDLVPESNYGGAVRAVNSVGAGAAESFSFVTDRVPMPPVLDVSLPDLNLSELEAIHINLDDYFSRAASYVVAGLPEGSGLALSGRAIIGTTNTNDTGASPLTITVTANNSDGSIQDAFSVSVVDDTPPVLSINSLTTLDTTPIVSGSSGDAVSLVLVVNGVTYNPVPSNGTWIQQLNELPLNTYVMTLNGQDAAGNAAIERKARLKVVNEIVESAGGLFQPLFRSLSRSVNNPMFR